jgi:ribonucleoside-diphosphate reductase alpha chain
MEEFKPVSRLTDMGKNILRKRYYGEGETKWRHVVDRVVGHVAGTWGAERKQRLNDMIYNRYFIPNSPTLVNAGKKKHAGLSACYVVPFEDTIEEIFKTKLYFALIARKGGGCGTTLSDLRPQGDIVNGSTHGFAGGAVPFADTISHDMDVITQAGFRSMAIMFTMSVYHPDIIKFITAKSEEGKIANANISVVVDNAFMEKVEKDETFWTEFNGKKYLEYGAREVFEKIVEGAWKNGEPALLFDDAINDSPYKYTGIKIKATNPCGEQPLPPYGSCNLGSLDLSKFLKGKEFNWELFEQAIRLSVRFLDSVIDVNNFPAPEIMDVSLKSRQIGLGVMGLADFFMKEELAYGSPESLEELEKIMKFLYETSKNESEIMGKELGVPEWCKKLPEKRRNITLVSIAPTGTISILAGCNSGIEPFFSEITERKDKTGQYTIDTSSEKEWFRCAVSSNGVQEVTWEEHVLVQATAQKWCDSGVSKTINFPSHTRRETIGKAFVLAWQNKCKGIAIYRNNSRASEVLSPKNLIKDKCPVCGEDTMKYDGCTKCTKCEWSICSVG